ncbi:MAG: methyltransferase domain-containing protein [Solirubrobacterales bacterium]|nr:methyltransferase domain-containing protein [Solirubrobacterales bacterium]
MVSTLGTGFSEASDADPIIDVVPLGDGRDVVIARPREPEALIDDAAFEQRDEFMPYWAELWPSAIALAKVLARRELGGRRVLELGCGVGLAGIAAAVGGARVTLTDWAPEAIAVAQANARRNDVEVEARVVDWRAPEELVAAAPWDLVVLADVLYEERNVDALLPLLPRLGPEILLADPDRAGATPFLEEASTGWRIDTTRDDTVLVHRLRAR